MEGKHLSKECRELFEKIFSYDPQERPSVNEIMNSTWLNKPTENTDEDIKFYLIDLIEK